MKIENKNANTTIPLLFNFEVNAEVSRHCLNFITYIYALRSEMHELQSIIIIICKFWHMWLKKLVLSCP